MGTRAVHSAMYTLKFLENIKCFQLFRQFQYHSNLNYILGYENYFILCVFMFPNVSIPNLLKYNIQIFIECPNI